MIYDHIHTSRDVHRLLIYVGENAPLFPLGTGDRLAAEWRDDDHPPAHQPTAAYHVGDGVYMTADEIAARVGIKRTGVYSRISRDGEGAHLLRAAGAKVTR
jgi:hypothetical protein